MNFVKCILAGLLSLVVGSILIVVGFLVVIAASVPHGDGSWSVDFVSVCRSFYIRCSVIAVCLFVLGFSWELRRLRMKSATTKPKDVT